MNRPIVPAWVYLLGYFPPLWAIGLVLIPVGDFTSQLASFGMGGDTHSSKQILTWPTSLYRAQRVRRLEYKLRRYQSRISG